jgi:hypothetical protein
MRVTKKVEDMLADLEKAAQLENSEVGEWWAALCNLRGSIENGGSDEFQKAWLAEVAAEHKTLKEDYRIVEGERTVTERYIDLEYLR